jgi:hypothetical protein
MNPDQAAFAVQYGRDARLRALGPTPELAFRAWASKRSTADSGKHVKGAASSRRGPWRKGDVLRVTSKTAYRATRDTHLPPWKAAKSWSRVA